MVRLLLPHSPPQLRRSDSGDCADVSHLSSSRAAVVVIEGPAANEGVTFLCKRQINYRHCRHHRHDQREHCPWMQCPYYYLFFNVDVGGACGGPLLFYTFVARRRTTAQLFKIYRDE